MTSLRRPKRRSRAAWGAFGLTLAIAALASIAGASAAAPVAVAGSVRVDPAVGTAVQNNIRLLTTSTGATPGCPSNSQRYAVSVTGPGAWSQGVTFDPGSPTAGVELDVPLSPTFAARSTALGQAIEPGRYDISILCQRLGQPLASFTGTIWFTDADHYQSTDPATTTTLTSLRLDDSPPGRSELGQTVTLTATVTPSTAAGLVQFRETLNDAPLPFSSPVRVTNGQAKLVVTSFTFGLHLMSATFIPDTPKRFAASSTPAPELALVVAKPVPPDVQGGPLIVGNPEVGSLLTCAGTVVRASSATYSWLHGGVPVPGATGRTYTATTHDRGQPLACRITAENDGGVASELSTPVTVGGAG